MEQFKQPGGLEEIPAAPVKASKESKKIQSVESMVKQLQETVGVQHHEIMKLHREISRLKSDISDIVTALRGRG